MTIAKVMQVLKEETLSILPAVLYFCIIFNIIYIVSGLALEPGTKRYFSHLSVTIFALVIGKVILLANLLPFINAFPHKPLIYNIVWKFIIYDSLVVILWAADSVVRLSIKNKDITIALQHVKHELSSPLFLATLIWLLLFFLIFILFSELIRAVGKEKVTRMMFG
jgi:hypothetical protein